MGIFWLTIGLTSIAWARSRGKDIRLARWSLVAGILGVFAGMIALLRPLLANYFSAWAIVSLLGALIIITGLLHIIGGFRIGSVYGSQWAWGSYMVRVFSGDPGFNCNNLPLGTGPGGLVVMASILSIISMQWYPICTATEPGMKVERWLSVNKFQELIHS